MVIRTILLLLILAGIVLIYNSFFKISVKTIPGQYPLGAARFEWPMAERSKEFRPSKLMGSDTIKLPNKTDAKTRCALATTC
jgi:hypothetical protein